MTKNQIKKEEIEQFLRKIWIFGTLKQEHIATLAKLVVVRQVKKSKIIWLQGQKVTNFTIVFYGQLRTIRSTASGSEKLVGTLPIGYHFGLAEMITGATSTVTLVADKASTILRLDYKSLRSELLSNTEICFRLMQTMARAIFGLTSELEQVSFENVHTRLARLLLKKTPQQFPESRPILNSRTITHEQLAVHLGVSRETVSRVLSDFRGKNLIKTSYRQIEIVDRDGLMEYIEDYDQW